MPDNVICSSDDTSIPRIEERAPSNMQKSAPESARARSEGRERCLLRRLMGIYGRINLLSSINRYEKVCLASDIRACCTDIGVIFSRYFKQRRLFVAFFQCFI